MTRQPREQLQPLELVARINRLRFAAEGAYSTAFSDPDHRIQLGVLGVVVFGWAILKSLPNLRRFDRPAFKVFWDPIEQQMRTDPLLIWVDDLRNRVMHEDGGPLHEIDAAGRMTFDRLPTTHGGKPIADQSLAGVLRVFLDYVTAVEMKTIEYAAQLQSRRP